MKSYEERSEEIRLILLDLEMPETNGLEAAERIRSFEKKHCQARVPVVGMTGYDDPLIKKQCIDSGMDLVFSKPVGRQQILNLLKQFQ